MRDLFYGRRIPDLFMRRAKDYGDWMLFCPNETIDVEFGKGLVDAWGNEFEQVYILSERAGKGQKTMEMP